MKDLKGELVHEENEWSHRIIASAIEVHRHLGPGLLERTYEDALCVEFEERQIPFERQVVIPVVYKGRTLQDHRLDLWVARKVIVEVKSVEHVAAVTEPIVYSYLRFAGSRLGLILNFRNARLVDGFKRIINVRDPNPGDCRMFES